MNIWKANLNFEENEVLSEACEVSVFLVEAKSPKVPSHYPFSSLLNLRRAGNTKRTRDVRFACSWR